MSGERVLVRMPNWVGDACMALPALDLLRSAGCQVVACGRGWLPGLLEGLGYETHVLPRGMVAQVRALGALRARRGLLLTNSFASALAMRLAGVDCLGLAADGRSFLLGSALPRFRGLHEVESFWRLAWAFVSDATPWSPRRRSWPRPPQRLGLRMSARQERIVEDALPAAGIHGDFVVLAPLAVGTLNGASKVWPHFAQLAAALHASGVSVVTCPGPGERTAMQQVAGQAAMLDDLDLGSYAAVCARARCVVANDSGPMHVAATVDATVLGIFGRGEPQRTGPWGLRARVVGDAQKWPDLVTVQAELVSILT